VNVSQQASRTVLDAIIQNVFGYGRIDAPLWFIGYEEHCEDERDAERRLSAMATFTGAQDVFDAHERMGHPNPVNTSVWPEMQEIVRAAGLRDVHVGRRDSDVFLVELLPLPHANKDAWYADLYGALGYGGRDEYVKAVLPKRIQSLRALVADHRPKVVLLHHSFNKDSLLRDLIGGKPKKQVKLGKKWLHLRGEGETLWLACANLSDNARWSVGERVSLRAWVNGAINRPAVPGGAQGAA
jgi:hypothetical protein